VSALIHDGITYQVPEHVQFIRDMEECGLEPYLYRGRHFFCGPAVNVDDIQTALSETHVPCRWDQLGKGYVVHPQTSDPNLRFDV
jgi:hypothetical protein